MLNLSAFLPRTDVCYLWNNPVISPAQIMRLSHTSAAVPPQPLIQTVSHQTAGLVKPQKWGFFLYKCRKRAVSTEDLSHNVNSDENMMGRMICKQIHKLGDTCFCRLADFIEMKHQGEMSMTLWDGTKPPVMQKLCPLNLKICPMWVTWSLCLSEGKLCGIIQINPDPSINKPKQMLPGLTWII